MKVVLLAAASVVALATAASAADLPTRHTAPTLTAAAPVFTWTGLYAGVSGGYVGTRDKLTGTGISNTNSPDGALFGADVGYNWQTGALVFGLEADLAYATTKGTSTTATLVHTTKLDSLGTVRGRVGYAVDRALFYVTGGLALADVSVSEKQSASYASTASWRTGWTLGGGIEYAVTPNWTVRAEGLYVDLGSKSAVDTVPASFKFKDTAVVARLGVNYPF